MKVYVAQYWDDVETVWSSYLGALKHYIRAARYAWHPDMRREKSWYDPGFSYSTRKDKVPYTWKEYRRNAIPQITEHEVRD